MKFSVLYNVRDLPHPFAEGSNRQWRALCRACLVSDKEIIMPPGARHFPASILHIISNSTHQGRSYTYATGPCLSRRLMLSRIEIGIRPSDDRHCVVAEVDISDPQIEQLAAPYACELEKKEH